MAAIVAVTAPIIVGLVKEFLSARKIKVHASLVEAETMEKRNEFLDGQIDTFRKHHEAQMDAWRDRYEILRDKYELEKEKVIRLEAKLEAATKQ